MIDNTFVGIGVWFNGATSVGAPGYGIQLYGNGNCSFLSTFMNNATITNNLVVKSRNVLNDIGNLTNLTTTAKTDLVSAINEVAQGSGGIPTTIMSADSQASVTCLEGGDVDIIGDITFAGQPLWDLIHPVGSYWIKDGTAAPGPGTWHITGVHHQRIFSLGNQQFLEVYFMGRWGRMKLTKYDASGNTFVKWDWTSLGWNVPPIMIQDWFGNPQAVTITNWGQNTVPSGNPPLYGCLETNSNIEFDNFTFRCNRSGPTFAFCVVAEWWGMIDTTCNLFDNTFKYEFRRGA
jgi:hypothetical protein